MKTSRSPSFTSLKVTGAVAVFALLGGLAGPPALAQQGASPDRPPLVPWEADDFSHYEVGVDFAPGSATLSGEAQAQLTRFADSMRDASPEILRIAVWADEPFPTSSTWSLTLDAQQLANERAEAVRSFLAQELKVSDVRVYNMARSASWLSRTLRRDDAALKAFLAGETDAPSPPLRDAANAIHDLGGPGRAVIEGEFRLAH
jgi:hypothetical protein